MKTQMFLVLIVALLHTSNCDSDGLVCYQCDKMALGRDCNLVDKCGPHQVCSNERFITNSGIVYYKSGCKPKIFCPSSGKKRSDVSDCLECCTQDYCNKDLCDFPKVTELEDRCLKCDDVDHPSQCTDVTRCGPDQICFTDLHFNYGLNSPRFVLGCRDKRSSLLQQCGSHLVNLFGRDSQKRSTTCHECCNTENCNRKLCVNATLNFIATTASQTSISRDLSTPPTKTQNATVKIDLSTTKLTTTQMFSSSALPTTTSSSTQTAPGSALLTAPSSVTQTAPGSALPTTPSSDIPTSQNIVLIVAFLDSAKCDSDGLVCYQCDNVAYGRDCNHIAKCGQHEVCSNERFITQSGKVYYKSGCKATAFCPPSSGRKRNDASDCIECCTKDYCNKDLCDYPKVTELENRCLMCDDVISPSLCRDVVRCGTDEICYADQNFNLGFHSPRFTLGCREKRQCTNHIVSLLGRDLEKRASACHECCNGENCNRKLCAHGTTHVTQATTQAPSSGTASGCADSVPNCKDLDNQTQICSNSVLAKSVCPKYCHICGQPPTCISIDPPVCATLSKLPTYCTNTNLVTSHKCFKTCHLCI